jgi:hypothetical protein
MLVQVPWADWTVFSDQSGPPHGHHGVRFGDRVAGLSMPRSRTQLISPRLGNSQFEQLERASDPLLRAPPRARE